MSTVILGRGGGGVTPVTPPTPATPRAKVVTRMTISSPAGSVDLLSDSRQLMLSGTAGLTGPDVDVDVDELAGVDGAFLRGAAEDRAGLILRPLDVVLTVAVHGRNPVECDARVAELRRVLSSRRYGPAALTVVRGDGTSRTLVVHHVPKAGDFDPTFGTEHTTRLVVLRLLAPQPLWTGVGGSAGPFALGGDTGLTFPLVFPVELAPSQVLGEANDLVVAGDELVYPRLTLDGPASSVEVTRADGRAYTVTGTLTAGQSLTVDHDPLAVLSGGQVVGPDGVDWTDKLDDGADLFPLRPGVEQITLDVQGAGVTSTIRLEWSSRYWSCIG